MGQLTTKEIQHGLLNWMTLAILFGSFASWIWAVRRLLRDEPVLPDSPLVERRKPIWGWGMLLVILAVLVVNVGGFGGYALATRGRAHGKRPDAPASKKGEEKKGERVEPGSKPARGPRPHSGPQRRAPLPAICRIPN